MVNFSPGTSYYWRMRAIQPGYGRYSEVRSFAIEPVLALVPELLTPANGNHQVSRKPAFSWSPFSGVSEYQFVLGDNITLVDPIIDTTVGTTAFAVTEELEYGQTYFWKVRAVKPAESGWSALANFTVVEKPTEPVPPVTIRRSAPVSEPTVVVILPEAPPSAVEPVSPKITQAPPSTLEPEMPVQLRIVIITASVLLLSLLTIITLIIKEYISVVSHRT
jgi:hypothetical protein